jgi:1-acyl-sn-glycerol-3-phosphate acyltransferase
VVSRAIETIGEATARRIADALLRRADRERLARLTLPDAGHGYDPFGAHPAWIAASLALGRFLCERYFRVESIGGAHIPPSGPAILAANHAGMLPLDAVMLHLDVLRRTDPPRLGRPVADWFVPMLPLVSTVYARSGVVSGSRRNVARLLESGALVELFPEGVAGIGKPFRARYHLQEWSVGHAELAIRHRAPVVPVAIIGSEEQWIQLFRIRRFHLFGAPYFPVPLCLIPLPVRYHIHYGEPLALHEGHAPDEADDPAIVDAAAARVKAAVQELIARGLRARRGIFR